MDVHFIAAQAGLRLVCPKTLMTDFLTMWLFCCNSFQTLEDNCIQIFQLGGILSDIRSKILFYGSALADP